MVPYGTNCGLQLMGAGKEPLEMLAERGAFSACCYLMASKKLCKKVEPQGYLPHDRHRHLFLRVRLGAQVTSDFTFRQRESDRHQFHDTERVYKAIPRQLRYS